MNRKQKTKRLLALLLVGVIGTSVTQGVGTTMASDNTTLVEVEKSLLEEDFNNTEDVTGWWDANSMNTAHGGSVSTEEVATGDNATKLTGNKVLKLTSRGGGNAVARIREKIDVSNLSKLTIKFDYKNYDSEHSNDTSKQLYLMNSSASMSGKLWSGNVTANYFWSGYSETWQSAVVEMDVTTGTDGAMILTYNDKTITTGTDGQFYLNFVAFVSQVNTGSYAMIDNVEITGIEKTEKFSDDFEGDTLLADWTSKSNQNSTVKSKFVRYENEDGTYALQMTTYNQYSGCPRIMKSVDVTDLDNLTIQFKYKTTTHTSKKADFYFCHYTYNMTAAKPWNSLSNLKRFWGEITETAVWKTVKIEFIVNDDGSSVTGTAYVLNDDTWEEVTDWQAKTFSTDNGTLHAAFLADLDGSLNSSTADADKNSVYLDDVVFYSENTCTLLRSDFEDCTIDATTGEGIPIISTEGENAWDGYTSVNTSVTDNERKNARTLVVTEDASWVQKDIAVTELSDDVVLEYQYKMNQVGNAALNIGGTATDNVTLNTTAVGEWSNVRVELKKDDALWNATIYQKDGAAWTSIGTTTIDATDSISLRFLTSADATIDNLRVYTIDTYTDGMSNTYTAPTIRDGASVRLVKDESGIRFEGYVNKEYVDTTLINMEGVESVQYGIMIAPKTYLNEECSDFTVAGLSAKYAENPYLKIEAVKKIDDGDNYKFQCAMIGLSNYATEFAARSYIEILGTDGSVTHVYSDFSEVNNVRSITEVARKALADATTKYSETEKQILIDYAAYDTVYVAPTSGDDANLATSDAPIKTLERALELAKNNGTIVLQETCTLAEDFEWPKTTKAVTIESTNKDEVNLDFSSQTTININSPITFENITFKFNSNGTKLFANGNALKIDSDVATYTAITLYGGGNGVNVDSTNLTVLAGNFTRIFGGGLDAYTKTTNLVVGGRVNVSLDLSTTNGTYHIFGGGENGTVDVANVTFDGSNAKARYLFGGSLGDSAKVGTANVTINAGTIQHVYGGNDTSSDIEEINVTVNGGKMEQLFGANQNASMTGNVVVDLQGGEITRRVYGGCYNTYGFGWSNDYHVTGNIELKISSDVNISLTGTDFAGETCEDLSIYACSRYNENFSDEVCTITYADKDAYDLYNGKLGANDSTMKTIMSDASPCDTSNASEFIIE